MKWHNIVLEKNYTDLELLKMQIVDADHTYYLNKTPQDSANILYATLDDPSSSWSKVIDANFKSYEEDSGDEACAQFVKWIKQDRKLRKR